MKKKITISTMVTLIILTAAVTISVTMLVAMRLFNRQVQSVAQRQAMYTHIDDVDKKVREYYSDIDEERLRQCITEGYVNGIGDSYAAYFTAEEYVAEQQRLAGKANDVGLAVCKSTSGRMMVSEVRTDSPADKSGLKKTDVITAVDGEEITSATSAAELQAKLDAADKVLLTVERDGAPVAFELSASPYTLRSVQSSLDGSIGYVKVTAFYENTPEQFKAAVSSLVQQGATGLIFDMRGNRGGSREAAEKVIGYLVPLGQYGCETDRNGVVSNLVSDQSNQLSISTVTLVNAETAGEAEFFAGVLQEMSLTTVVGDVTAGKAKFQAYYTLESDSSAIKLTVGEYSRLKNGSWEGTGIQPDSVVTLSADMQAVAPLLEQDKDPQYLAGVAQFPGNAVNAASTTAAK